MESKQVETLLADVSVNKIRGLTKAKLLSVCEYLQIEVPKSSSKADLVSVVCEHLVCEGRLSEDDFESEDRNVSSEMMEIKRLELELKMKEIENQTRQKEIENQTRQKAIEVQSKEREKEIESQTRLKEKELEIQSRESQPLFR